jgi:hypothetical protein
VILLQQQVTATMSGSGLVDKSAPEKHPNRTSPGEMISPPSGGSSWRQRRQYGAQAVAGARPSWLIRREGYRDQHWGLGLARRMRG